MALFAIVSLLNVDGFVENYILISHETWKASINIILEVNICRMVWVAIFKFFLRHICKPMFEIFWALLLILVDKANDLRFGVFGYLLLCMKSAVTSYP